LARSLLWSRGMDQHLLVVRPERGCNRLVGPRALGAHRVIANDRAGHERSFAPRRSVVRKNIATAVAGRVGTHIALGQGAPEFHV